MRAIDRLMADARVKEVDIDQDGYWVILSDGFVTDAGGTVHHASSASGALRLLNSSTLRYCAICDNVMDEHGEAIESPRGAEYPASGKLRQGFVCACGVSYFDAN